MALTGVNGLPHRLPWGGKVSAIGCSTDFSEVAIGLEQGRYATLQLDEDMVSVACHMRARAVRDLAARP